MITVIVLALGLAGGAGYLAYELHEERTALAEVVAERDQYKTKLADTERTLAFVRSKALEGMKKLKDAYKHDSEALRQKYESKFAGLESKTKEAQKEVETTKFHLNRKIGILEKRLETSYNHREKLEKEYDMLVTAFDEYKELEPKIVYRDRNVYVRDEDRALKSAMAEYYKEKASNEKWGTSKVEVEHSFSDY